MYSMFELQSQQKRCANKTIDPHTFRRTPTHASVIATTFNRVFLKRFHFFAVIFGFNFIFYTMRLLERKEITKSMIHVTRLR